MVIIVIIIIISTKIEKVIQQKSSFYDFYIQLVVVYLKTDNYTQTSQIYHNFCTPKLTDRQTDKQADRETYTRAYPKT